MALLLMSQERKPEGTGRGRGPVRMELRPIEEPLSAEELRWREQELERLIIKAACHRAARLAGQSNTARGTGG